MTVTFYNKKSPIVLTIGDFSGYEVKDYFLMIFKDCDPFSVFTFTI